MTIRAIPLDVYGTLLNVHSMIAREESLVGARTNALPQFRRGKQLEYTMVWLLRDEYGSIDANHS